MTTEELIAELNRPGSTLGCLSPIFEPLLARIKELEQWKAQQVRLRLREALTEYEAAKGAK